MTPTPAARPVPWRTIWGAIGAVLITWVGIQVIGQLRHAIGLLIVAGFFAIVLTPPVDAVERRIGGRRGLATLLVFVAVLAIVGAMLATFVTPVVRETQDFVESFPGYVAEAREGRGPVGGLVERFDLDERIDDNREALERYRNQIGGRALSFALGVFSTAFGLLTVLVLAFLMVVEGPHISRAFLGALTARTAERVRHVGSDCAKAVTGYVAGNLVISLVAGITTFVALTIIGVPFNGVLALWVAFADLIPLVGATLGAIPTIGVAFLHSPQAGVATLAFFVIYQQIENHLLQPTVMSRTVDLNPLTVLVSVLVGVELSGVLGALLAIPAAGIAQVIVRDIYDERRGRLKPEPTIGTDEVPLSEVLGDQADDTPEDVGGPLP